MSDPQVGGAALGIDVSHFQANVNWGTVTANTIAFAFIKASEGAARKDALFATHWQGAKAAGVIRGAYHFFHPKDPIGDQVTNFLAATGALDADDLPPVLDLEETSQHADEWDTIPLADRVGLAVQWLESVKGTLGRTPIVYTRKGFVAAKLSDATPLAAYPLWVAHYTDAPQPALPSVWSQWTFWQYSENGTVPGVAGNVDRNRFNGSVAALKAWVAAT